MMTMENQEMIEEMDELAYEGDPLLHSDYEDGKFIELGLCQIKEGDYVENVVCVFPPLQMDLMISGNKMTTFVHHHVLTSWYTAMFVNVHVYMYMYLHNPCLCMQRDSYCTKCCISFWKL